MTKNTKIILIVVGVMVFLLCICSATAVFLFARAGKKVADEIEKQVQQDQSTTPTPTKKTISGGKNYANSSGGFNLMYPGDWRVEENKFGALALLYSPKEGNSDAFVENLNVSIEDLNGESITLDEYSEAAIGSLDGVIGELQFVNEDYTTLGGKRAYFVEYTGTNSGIDLKWRQVWTIHNGQAYIVTYTAAPESFNTFKANVDDILASFEFTK